MYLEVCGSLFFCSFLLLKFLSREGIRKRTCFHLFFVESHVPSMYVCKHIIQVV